MKEELEYNNTEEIKNNISSLLDDSLEEDKKIYDLYLKSNIPEIVKGIDLSGLNINAIQDKLKFYNSIENNKSTDGKDYKDLNIFIQKILYPVVTYYYLEENKKGKSIKDINLMRNDEQANLSIFLGKALEYNLVINLNNLIESNPSILQEEIREKAKSWINNMRKKATIALSAIESKKYLEGKLFLEKVYLDLLLNNKIELQ